MKITLDSCIIFDYLREDQKDHKKAKILFSTTNFSLYITETVLREIRDQKQYEEIQVLINEKKLIVLKEPSMGTPIPTAIPMDLSDISPIRDEMIKNFLAKRKGMKKHTILKDFLIAEAHKLSGNAFLLTTNHKHFYENFDTVVVNYDELFNKLKLIKKLL